MAFPYSITPRGSAEYFFENWSEIVWDYHPDFKKKYNYTINDARLLATYFHKFLAKELEVYSLTLDFLKRSIEFFLVLHAEYLKDDNFSFIIPMPDGDNQMGFYFSMTYCKEKRKRLKVTFFDKNKRKAPL